MMKKIVLLTLSSLFLILITSSCLEDRCEKTINYIGLEPIYMSYEDFRSSVKSEAPRELEVPGKLYVRGAYIFISEVNKGVHIIDNSDPSNPKNVSFINVPGNRDIAVQGDVLYADSHIDLVSIDISNLQDVKVLHRVENVFPFVANNQGFWADETRGIVQEWKEVEITEVVDCNYVNNKSFQGDFRFNTLDAALSSSSGEVSNSFANANANGVGGSLARFAIVGDMMYAVTDLQLVLFNITDPTNFNTNNRIDLGFGIETIFPYKENLFIGSQTGMFVYNVTNPQSPQYLSEWEHFRACDPVAVEGDMAYVTLRTGSGCAGNRNQLHVVDITDILNPNRIAVYQMTNPHGLGIRNDVLFICDGTAGLKVYNAEDPLRIAQRRLGGDADIQALDVIPLEKFLLLIGEDGFHQYDYSDLNNIRKISSIPVKAN